MMVDQRRDLNIRPSPDALLEAARREERRAGRLKIFVGAAPGVGKTYEMLQQAHARLREGSDVVVGIVETHGRIDTEALLGGLEIIPRRTVDYRGQQLDEMDIDAILARMPDIVLVDELAHTNAKGGRHPKRYLDVEEILANGIDVYTTVNIQHIESLNDVIAQITHVQVRETIPDTVFNEADAVELIDITPQDLIQRLKDGKVYVPKQAERALTNFFSPANLTALRELALRRTADRVDEQLLLEMQAGAIAGPWAAGDRILVCINENKQSAGLVRYAKRLSDRMHAPFMALCVETRRMLQMSEKDRNDLADALRLAESLGGDAVTIPAVGRTIADDIVGYAQANNVTQVLIEKSEHFHWINIFRGSLVDELARKAGNISIHLIAGHDLDGAAPIARTTVQISERQAINVANYIWGVIAVLAALGTSQIVQPFFGLETVDLVFLLAVLAVAIRLGLGPSLVASVAASLCYNFFFLPPIYTFSITDPTNLASFAFFVVVAVVVSNVAARVRAQAMVASLRARTTESLYLFSKKLAGVGSLDDVLWAIAYQTALMLKVRVVLLLPEGEQLAVRGAYPPEDILDDADLAAAKWAWQNNRPAGRGSDTLPGTKRLFLTMRTGRGAIGVMGVDNDRSGPLFSPDDRRLLDALIDQSALAIERVFLVEDMDKVKRVAETDRLRSALLTSISHDLKTPLAAILGSATTMRSLSGQLGDAEKSELLTTIVDESERLNRFIANLLDMTRLEAGAIAPNMAFYEPREIAGTALRRAEKILTGHNVELELEPNLPMIKVDAVLLEQALFNLLDNAAKYAPAGTKVTVEGELDGKDVVLRVVDEGEGMPPADIDAIFDKFYRAQKGDSVRPGTGLGLAIARGFIEAMQGSIVAANRRDRSGAVFTIRFEAQRGHQLMVETQP